MTVTNTDNLLALDCQNLTYSWVEGDEPVLKDVNLDLTKGDRCLLLGANGAGKSTLLRILAGKRLTKTRSCKILGQDVFMNPPGGVVYLGTEWSTNPVVRSDIVVSHFLDSVGGYRHKERRDRLLQILDVDLDWYVCISDGERRRVQLCMGLMGEWDVLLLDEVTVDLDVLVRADLIDFLVSESEIRGATIVYATHIFDGLRNFPTKICHMQLGSTPRGIVSWPPANVPESELDLFTLALGWLREDRELRRVKEKEKGRVRGPKTDTKDRITFYEKYDYSH
ncbi:CCR4-NOT complex subunit CAF16 [Kwoniella mangroviensis CBS 10435]|uniref:CCR4-NOT complex subunit CAF16 n=1 Tax=Kwoniella mangroviensis CBS 10435 TaxID=1331196 RepID=A0A1B9IPQ2_9TREE|nr:CCR4-NOT complex subunit CAF16 [Kwoniella mangroviensis CBS 8507]OCF57384.1 CCR4-NOT complex subunit CAF16 [Kwoniella mangroviensis CBS 10435]OCF70286.1 CCR4-NOT complex subunit CAF16 [Kwoniella mangroviensis CBS 8507]